MESRATTSCLRVWTVLVVLFLYVPLAVIVLYAFNRSNVQTWPIKHFSTRWFSVAWHDQEVRDAFVLSLKAPGRPRWSRSCSAPRPPSRLRATASSA